MGVAGIPTGYLLGKMSRKSVTLVGLVISAATYLTAYSRGLPDLLLYRFVSGLGEAMQLTALLAIGTSYFFQHRAVAASSLNFTFGIGAIIGSTWAPPSSAPRTGKCPSSCSACPASSPSY